MIGWLVGLMAILRLSKTGSELCRTALLGFFGQAITSFIGLYEVAQGTWLLLVGRRLDVWGRGSWRKMTIIGLAKYTNRQ